MTPLIARTRPWDPLGGPSEALYSSRRDRRDVVSSSERVRSMYGTAQRTKLCRCEVVHGSVGCGWESLMKNVTLGNVTMSHRTRERPAECLASLSHSTMIGLPRAQH
ncbi:hypothetical protein EVAR_89021_1 [Eumeta japonica]|uniref:Uncharacterized protein n=1 Tax=Eumeta variegata TaxID=151549 RepID=A0A4C1XA64_EUMVA|nr:hypothetical protein EVAR_89021_1 [Eumeta japonica]